MKKSRFEIRHAKFAPLRSPPLTPAIRLHVLGASEARARKSHILANIEHLRKLGEGAQSSGDQIWLIAAMPG
jgi:hypothetical protein